MAAAETRPVFGIFGGSFNPPHIAHALATLLALEAGPCDRVLWLPTYRHAFGKELAPFSHRVAMARLASQAFGDRCEVLELEQQVFAGGEPSRTLPVVEALRQALPQVELRLIIGSDILHEVSAWHKWENVVRAAPPWVIPRQGYALPVAHPHASVALPGVSSTEIRAQLAAQGSSPHLSRSVLGYIVEHGLYRDL